MTGGMVFTNRDERERNSKRYGDADPPGLALKFTGHSAVLLLRWALACTEHGARSLAVSRGLDTAVTPAVVTLPVSPDAACQCVTTRRAAGRNRHSGRSQCHTTGTVTA